MFELLKKLFGFSSPKMKPKQRQYGSHFFRSEWEREDFPYLGKPLRCRSPVPNDDVQSEQRDGKEPLRKGGVSVQGRTVRRAKGVSEAILKLKKQGEPK